MNILVTGGAGFIGSNFILSSIDKYDRIINLDLLTYSGNLNNLKSILNNNKYKFVHGDIADKNLVNKILYEEKIDVIINFAAESHVDRSIFSPIEFIKTNVLGTTYLLIYVLEYYNSLSKNKKENFRFLHVSTDEVFGSLNENENPFNEETPYKPNSPYSASKASSDHLVRAFAHTYKLPILITNCSNNYGPYQFPEKLIPLIIQNALKNIALPVYGNGLNIRDWLYVIDHCNALQIVLEKGIVGETYCIGGNTEIRNIEVVKLICKFLDTCKPLENKNSYLELINFIEDRKGHDKRYAINNSKIKKLGWEPKYNFNEGLELTLKWYLENQDWVEAINTKEYQNWLKLNYST